MNSGLGDSLARAVSTEEGVLEGGDGVGVAEADKGGEVLYTLSVKMESGLEAVIISGGNVRVGVIIGVGVGRRVGGSPVISISGEGCSFC